MIVPLPSPAVDTASSDVNGYRDGMWSVVTPTVRVGGVSVELSAPVAA